MHEPRILFKGRFQLEDIQTHTLEKKWTSTSEYDHLVSNAWEIRLKEAKEKAIPTWDGIYYRVTNISEIENATSDSLVLKLGTVPYRYIGTFSVLKEQYFSLGLAPLYHLSTAAIMRTNDGYYLFGKRTNNGIADLIGGGVQEDEVKVESGTDLARNLYKEIQEESGIKRMNIESMTGIGITLSATSNVLIVAYVDLRLSREEAIAAFMNREDNEMAEPIFVPEDQLIEFLKSMGSYRVLIPSLLEK